MKKAKFQSKNDSKHTQYILEKERNQIWSRRTHGTGALLLINAKRRLPQLPNAVNFSFRILFYVMCVCARARVRTFNFIRFQSTHIFRLRFFPSSPSPTIAVSERQNDTSLLSFSPIPASLSPSLSLSANRYSHRTRVFLSQFHNVLSFWQRLTRTQSYTRHRRVVAILKILRFP